MELAGDRRAHRDSIRVTDLHVYAIKLAAAVAGHSDAWHGHQDERRALLWAEGQGFIRKLAVLNADTVWELTEKGARLAQHILDHGALGIRFDGVGGWSGGVADRDLGLVAQRELDLPVDGRFG